MNTKSKVHKLLDLCSLLRLLTLQIKGGSPENQSNLLRAEHGSGRTRQEDATHPAPFTNADAEYVTKFFNKEDEIV